MINRALCVGVLAATAAFGTVGTALAAEAPAPQTHVQAVGAAASGASVAERGTIAPSRGSVVPNVTPAVFSCSYVSLVPFNKFQFSCAIQSGTVQLHLVCSNGQQVFGPAMRAIGNYFPILACPVGTQATSILWQAL